MGPTSSEEIHFPRQERRASRVSRVCRSPCSPMHHQLLLLFLSSLLFSSASSSEKPLHEKKIHGERYIYYATEVDQNKVIKKVIELAKVWGFQIEEEADPL